MNEPALNLILFPSNPFPKALDTPRFKALWDNLDAAICVAQIRDRNVASERAKPN